MKQKIAAGIAALAIAATATLTQQTSTISPCAERGYPGSDQGMYCFGGRNQFQAQTYERYGRIHAVICVNPVRRISLGIRYNYTQLTNRAIRYPIREETILLTAAQPCALRIFDAPPKPSDPLLDMAGYVVEIRRTGIQ